MPDNDLPASARIKKPAVYKQLYQSAYRGQSQLHRFHLQCVKGRAKLGVTVSKKVSKSAVNRNFIKRQIREHFRLHQTMLQNLELVITAKPECGQATVQAQRASLHELWQRISKWRRWYRHNR